MTTSVVTCPTSATVVDAAKQMRDCDVGNVLVMDDKQLTGILTDRDIVVRCVAQGGDIANAHLSDVCSGDVAVERDPDSALSDISSASPNK
jgi:signal-transduction protein with cAMP-binding, CBS, and nucleotidyltransferase domain